MGIYSCNTQMCMCSKNFTKSIFIFFFHYFTYFTRLRLLCILEFHISHAAVFIVAKTVVVYPHHVHPYCDGMDI